MPSSESASRKAVRIPFSTDSCANAVSASAKDFALAVAAGSCARKPVAATSNPKARKGNFMELDKNRIWRRLNLKRP